MARKRKSQPTTETVSAAPGSDRTFLLVLIGTALAVRALFYLFAWQVPLFHAPMVDESWHHQWAQELVAHGWAYPQVYFRAPLYPYFLSVLYAMSGESIAFARAVQLIISTFSVVLLYFVARRVMPRTIARVAALVMCMYGTLIWYEQALLIPVLIIALNLLVLYLFLRFKESGAIRTLALAGLLSGLSLIARPNIAIFVGGIGIWLFFSARRTSWWPRLKPIVVYWGLALLPVLPVVYHNYAYSGDFIPIASQGGINFYLGNNPEADGLTMRMPELDIGEALPWHEFVPATDSIAQELADRPLSPGEISGFWMDRFWRFVTREPDLFLLGLMKKTYFFFAGAENPDNFDLYFYRNLNPVFALLVWRWGLHFPFGLVAPLALLGGWWLWKRRRELDILYLFVLLYAPTVIGVLVTARHRLPVIPILVIFAVYGAFELVRRLRAGPAKSRAIWGGIAALLLIFLNTELFGVGFENKRQSHVNLALAAKKLGDTELMVEHLDSALAIDSSSVVALNNRGVAYMNAGDLYMARRMFRLALSLDHSSEEVRNNLATVLMRQGSFESAMLMYRELAVLHPDMVEPVYNMARVFAAQQELDSALAYYDRALKRDSTYVEAINNKGSIYLARGDTATAVELWMDAFRINPGYPTAGGNLVRSYLDAGQSDSARAILDRAQRPWRESPDWYYNSVITAQAAGDTARAREILVEGMRWHPDAPPLQTLALRLGVS